MTDGNQSTDHVIPTPRTDEAARKVACVGIDGEGNHFHGVPVAFARELERELIELRKEYGKLARGEVFVHL